MAWRLTLTLLDGEFAVCRLGPDAATPVWAMAGPFVSITRTRDELSVVCLRDLPPLGTRMESGWRCLRIEGPFPLETTVGVLAALAAPLAAAAVSIFVVSSYDTDYLLLLESQLTRAVAALAEQGHVVRPDSLPTRA